MTAEFKKEILGDFLYQKITKKSRSDKSPKLISEELKHDMLGDKFYNGHHKKTRAITAEEMGRLMKVYTFSHIEEGHALYELEISLSQKPPSRGRRR